jgi:uncharacterized SAM-binding protein YcdF (DUF218 family)
MFFYLSKILWFVADPGNLFLMVLAIGAILLWTRKARFGRGLIAVALLFALVIAVFPVGVTMLAMLEERFAKPDPMPERVAGIIVLGGALNQFIAKMRGDTAVEIAGGRLAEFVRLARRYPDAKLVFTGGSGSLRDQSVKEADYARPILRSWGLDTARVTFENRSRNTFENAEFSKSLVRPQPGENWMVITSAFHMPRAIGVFRRAGWNVLPVPVDYQTAGDKSFWQLKFRFRSGMNTFARGVHEWLGLSFYWLTGRTDTLLPAPYPSSAGQGKSG